MAEPQAAEAAAKAAALVAETRKLALAQVEASAAALAGAGRLAGKVGIITGVGDAMSIGAATAKLFAREGAAHLYLVDVHEANLAATVDALRAAFPNVELTPVVGDAASEDVVAALVTRARDAHGRFDFYHANAGVSQRRRNEAGRDHVGLFQPLDATSADDFMEIMRLNALSGFLAIKHAAPAMATLCPAKGKTVPGGSIVLTASVAAKRANMGPISYSASKAALVSLAQTCAYALAGTNVRVNAVCPGLIETAMTGGLFKLAAAAGRKDAVGAQVPLKRQGLAHEVAHAVLFLASDESSYVNGEALVVDGGLVAG